MSVRRPSRRDLLLAALGSAALAGCGGIPARGPVVPGRAVDDGRVLDRSVLVAGPVPGATPEQVVRGFLQAQAGFEESHRVARLYLVNGPRWRSDTSTRVVRDDQSLRVVRSDAAEGAGGDPLQARVVVEAPLVAVVDSAGVYRAAAPGARWTAELTLRRVDGQWRIADPQNGIVLPAAVFQFVFSRFPVYFPDRSATYLVPDVRWLPTTSGTTTTLVRTLLAGPAPWLAPAVATGVPSGTTLAVPAVVADDVATIDLSRQTLTATPRERRLLVQQLRATLATLGLRDFRVTVERTEYATSASAPAPSGVDDPLPVTDPLVDPRPLVVDAGGRVARVSGREIAPVAGLEQLAVGGIVAPGSDATGSSFVVLADRRSRLLQSVPGSVDPPQVLASGPDLVAPSTDPRGWVWTVPAASGPMLVARPSTGQVRVRAPWLAGLRVVSLRVSRDGARLLVAATGQGRAWLLLAGIQRSVTGAPVRVGQAEDLVPDLTDVVDAAWADEMHAVLVGTRVGTGRRPWRLLVGGPVEPLPDVPRARTIAARTVDEVFVSTEDGRLLQSAGSGWVDLGQGSWVSMPG